MVNNLSVPLTSIVCILYLLEKNTRIVLVAVDKKTIYKEHWSVSYAEKLLKKIYYPSHRRSSILNLVIREPWLAGNVTWYIHAVAQFFLKIVIGVVKHVALIVLGVIIVGEIAFYLTIINLL